MSSTRQLKNRISEALALIENWCRIGKKVLILAKRGVDGACSAGIMAKLLTHYRCPFEAKAMGSEELLNWLQDRPMIILDLPLPSNIKIKGGWLHISHLLPLKEEDGIVSIYPGLAGSDGFSEACTTSLLYLMMREAGIVEDEGSLTLLCTGVQGEGQVGPPPNPLKGLNDGLLSPLIGRGLVKVGKSLSLFSSKAPLSLAIATTIDPPLKRVLGSEDDVREMLKRAGLANLADKPLSMLDEEARGKLIQCLLVEALSSGLEVSEAEGFVKVSLKIEVEGRLEDVAEVARSVDVCAKLGKLALSIQSFLRKRPTVFDEERLKTSLACAFGLSKEVRRLIAQLDAQPTACLFKLDSELGGFALDVVRCLTAIHSSARLGTYTCAGNHLKASIAWGKEVSEGEEITNKLISIVEAHRGLYEAGPRWIEVVVPVEVLSQVEEVLRR